MSEIDEKITPDHDANCDVCGKNVNVDGIDKHEENPSEREDVTCDTCQWKAKFDPKKLDLVVDGVDTKDFPDFCDAYCSENSEYDGKTLEVWQGEWIDENYPELINGSAYEKYM